MKKEVGSIYVSEAATPWDLNANWYAGTNATKTRFVVVSERAAVVFAHSCLFEAFRQKN